MPNPVIIIRSVFVVFFVCFFNDVKAKHILYDESKGLSNSFVTQIIKDKAGLMWIGTQDGLNTFDGYNFAEIQGLKNRLVNHMIYDSIANVLWVACSSGLFYVNVTTGDVIECTAKISNKNVVRVGIFQQNVYAVFANGSVMEITPKFACRVIFRLAAVTTIPNAKFSNAVFDNKGNAYITLTESSYLLVVNLLQRKWLVSSEFIKHGIWSIYEGDGICILNLNNQKIALYQSGISGQPIIRYINLPAVVQTETIRLINQYNNRFYFCMRENYNWYTLDSTGNNFQPLYSKKDDELFKAWTVKSLYHDGDNILWIGTNKGLIKSFKHPTYPFRQIFSAEGKTVSVRQIVEGRKNQLYIATYDGIYEYNKLSGSYVLLKPQHHHENFPLYSRALYFDQENYLYSAAESNFHYLCRYNLSKRTFETDFYNVQSGGIEISSIFCIYKNKNSNLLWLGTDKGLATFDPLTKIIQLHYNDSFSIGVNRIMYIGPGKSSSQFWVAAQGGFYLMDVNRGKAASFTHDQYPLMPDDEYIYATVRPNNDIWLGTLKSGVVILQADFKTISVFNKTRGLPSNNVYSVLWQNNDIAWMSTSNGLCRYDATSRNILIFLVENGLSDNEFNQNSAFVDRDGSFYLGGINGVNVFNPHNIQVTHSPINIFVSGITKWHNARVVPVEAPDLNIFINPDDHLLTFSLGLSDYIGTENNSFYYKIRESGSDWLPIGNSNKLRLDGLPAGRHRLEVIGFNRYGQCSTNKLAYTIVIGQVFYKTVTFYIILTLGMLGLGLFAFRWTLSNMNQKQKLRTQIASNLHDEVGSLLTSIIISTDSARYTSNTVEEKNMKLEKISQLSRTATSTMSDVLWSIDARNDYAGNLTDRMREHAESMFDPLGIDIAFHFDTTIQRQNIDPQIRQQLYLIFKEAINNIVKHSKATLVTVYYTQNGRDFTLTIKNNNHLLYSEMAGYVGQGLKNMEMRARNINAKCQFFIEGDDYVVSIKS